MNASSNRNLKLRKILFASLLVLICITVVYAIHEQNKPWIVPEEYKRLQNPLQPSESNLQSAARLYTDECAECHGDHGKGDGPKSLTHTPPPADLTDAARMAKVTDGEIFYQISEGKRPMPAFKNRMTQDQRWQLVLFVRSFSRPTLSERNPGAPPSSQPALVK